MRRKRGAQVLVDQASYRNVKHASSLKGLLKPFKGKGELEVLEQQLLGIQDGLKALMDEVVDSWARPPFSLLPVNVLPHASTSGASHLRWRTRGRGARMGVGVWNKQMLMKQTPPELLDELHSYEILRIRYNMQMTCVQFIIKQVRECQEKLQDAESIYSQACFEAVKQHEKRSVPD